VSHDSTWRLIARWGVVPPMLVAIAATLCFGQAAAPKTIALPSPRQSGGKPLMEVLAQPATLPDLAGGRFSMQTLADLLWAGAGSARAASDPATPGGAIAHATDVFVLLKAGAFAYDPVLHSLRQVVAQDIRGLCGMQDPRWQAPVTLIYVVDLARSTRPGVTERELTAAMDAGAMAQSVTLYCASEGLSASERPILNRRSLARRLGLRSDQRIVAAQVVGYQQK
jgi:hypothetical protein